MRFGIWGISSIDLRHNASLGKLQLFFTIYSLSRSGGLRNGVKNQLNFAAIEWRFTVL
ncbi:MAG: hypothetical protein HC895_05225 [Leptolyngbyaceae cyanobacterium SM1_3_5]|nr:hypothetical protein [Leptolyngbyaceae cyanobacterium SM1_3_5]